MSVPEESTIQSSESSGGFTGSRTGSLHGALFRYRVMAYTTAVLLIVLVFVGIPLQVAANRPQVASVVGTVHGFCYIVYLFTAFDLTRRLGLKLGKMVFVLLAGTVPFCAIIAERLLTKLYRSTVEAAAPVVPAAPKED